MSRSPLSAIIASMMCAVFVFNARAYTEKEVREKISGYTRMQNAGTGLMIGGIVLAGVGPFLLVNGIRRMANDESWDAYSNENPDGYWTGYGGALCLGFGVSMTVGGGVLQKIGRNKIKEYKRRLERFSLRVGPNSIGLVYDCNYRRR